MKFIIDNLFNDKSSNTIKNEELEEKMKNSSVFILDVREPMEYSHGRVPGSKLIPLRELENRISELDKNEEIHVICHTGSRASMAVRILKNNGFENITKVTPGISRWKGKIEKD